MNTTTNSKLKKIVLTALFAALSCVATMSIKLPTPGTGGYIHPGDAKEILPTLDGQYDIIFVDAAKAQYGEFFPHCMRMLKTGGLLVSDNVLYKGMTATDELMKRRKITIIKRLRNYLSMLSSHNELSTTVLPIGDGVALSVHKKKELPND